MSKHQNFAVKLKNDIFEELYKRDPDDNKISEEDLVNLTKFLIDQMIKTHTSKKKIKFLTKTKRYL